MAAIRMLNCGEQGLVVEFGSRIAPAITARVHRLAKAVRSAIAERIVEVVPTYRSLMIYFDPLVIGRSALKEEIAHLLLTLDASTPEVEMTRLIKVPVSYGGEFGPELEVVARHNGLSEDEVVAIHTSARYLVCMLGFTPGFAYLGGMSERIAAPRLDIPRLRTPAGSVGIAGLQTGIYSVESPGGWRIIGRTPLQLFNAFAERPFLFAAGDHVEFVTIDAEQFRALQRQVEAGSYSPEIRPVQTRVHGH